MTFFALEGLIFHSFHSLIMNSLQFSPFHGEFFAIFTLKGFFLQFFSFKGEFFAIFNLLRVNFLHFFVFLRLNFLHFLPFEGEFLAIFYL